MVSRKGIPNPLNAKHYLSSHPVYWVWATVKNRCYNKNEPSYANYGKLGVRMCDEWKNDPKAFIEWALAKGWKKGLQIDKDIIAAKLGVKPDLYSPDRCLFVTPKENCNQRKSSKLIEYKGITKTLAQWSEEMGIKASTLHMRLKKHGYSVEKAFNEPISYNKPGKLPANNRWITRSGQTKNLKQWCQYYGISVATLRSRIRSGWSFEKALTGENERKRIGPDLREAVIRLHQSGETQLSIARKLNMARTTVGRIIKSI